MKETSVKKQEALPPKNVGSYNDMDLSEGKIQELSTHLYERLKNLKSLNERSLWESEKARAFNAYHMVPKDRELPYAGAANLSSPFPRIGVDSFHANVMASLHAKQNKMAIKPVLIQADYANTAKKAAQYIEYVVNEEGCIYKAIDDADRKSQMYGISYIEPYYIKEETWDTVEITDVQRIPQADPKTGKVTIKEVRRRKTEKKKRTKFDGTKFESIPVESIFVTPFATSLEQAVREDVVFKYCPKSFYDIKEQSKGEDTPFYDSGQVKKIEPYVVSKMTKHLTEIEQARAQYDGFYLDALFREEQVDLYQAYLWFDIDGDKIKEQISVVFHPESGAVLRTTLSPCRIVEFVPRPIDGRLIGEGIPKITEPLDEEWETFHNTRANAGQWSNSFFGFYRAGGRFNPQKIVIQPNHFYPIDDPREVSFPQKQQVTSSYFQEEQMMWNIFERLLAIDENMQGVATGRRTSATETINVSQRSSIRFGNPFNRIVESVNKLLTHVWELNRECSPVEKEFYVIGADGAPIFDKMRKYEYRGNLRFSVAVSPVFDQQLTRDTALLVYRLFLVNPIVQQHPEMIYEISQNVLDTLNIGVKLPKPPQAKTMTPFEEHELFKDGESPEPEVGEDYDHHLKTHMTQLNSPDIKEWEVEAVRRLVMHIDKTQILKQTLESANLNKSGIFAPGGGMPPQPGLTSNRNPTQMFNTTKVGESGASSRQNLKNMNDPNAINSNVDNVLGQGI